MKKLIYILFGVAVFTAKSVCAQSGINNNSDFHVPVQVPTIPQAPAITVVTTVAVPELTITPITTTIGAANLAPTALEVPAMPPAPTPAAIAAAPVAAPAVTPTGGVNAPAGTAATVTVTQAIPALPPVPPVAAIPELQLSL
jgi:hypothetical protein